MGAGIHVTCHLRCHSPQTPGLPASGCVWEAICCPCVGARQEGRKSGAEHGVAQASEEAGATLSVKSKDTQKKPNRTHDASLSPTRASGWGAGAESPRQGRHPKVVLKALSWPYMAQQGGSADKGPGQN